MSVDVAPAIQEEEHVHMLAESFLAPSNAPESLDVSMKQDSTHIDTTLDDASGGVGATHDIVEEDANVADNATDTDATTNDEVVDDAIEIASIPPQTPIIITPAAEDATPVVEPEPEQEDVQNGRPQSPSVTTQDSGTPTEVLTVEVDTSEDAVHANEGALHDGAGSEDIASVPNPATEVVTEEGPAPELDAEVSVAEETPIPADIKVEDISGVDDVASPPQVHPTAESEPEAIQDAATSAPYSTTEDASVVTEESSAHDVVAEVPLGEVEVSTREDALPDTTTVPTVPIEGSMSEDIVPADTIPAIVESEPEAVQDASSVPIIAEVVEESIPVVDAEVPSADALPDTTTVDAVPTVPIDGSTSEDIVPVTGGAQADAIPVIVESEPEAASVPSIAEDISVAVEENIPVVDAEVPPAEEAPAQSQEDLAEAAEVVSVPQASEETEVADPEAYSNNTVVVEEFTEGHIEPVTEGSSAHEEPAASVGEQLGVDALSTAVEAPGEVERPKSPWTPSYSVTTQGPSAELEAAADLAELPPPVEVVAALPGDGATQEGAVLTVVELEPEAVGESDPSSIEETVAGQTEIISAVNADVETELEARPEITVNIPATEDTGPLQATSEDQLQADKLSAAHDDEEVVERPKSPWTPSYSVTTQGPGIPTLDELEVADLPVLPPPAEISIPSEDAPPPATAEDVTHNVPGSDEPEIVVEEPDTASVLVSVAQDESSEEAETNFTAESELEAKTLVVEATSIETNADLDANVDTVAEVDAGPGEVVATEAEDPPQLAILRDQQEIDRPKSPWTPSYSVTTQGPGIPTPDELDAADLAVLPPPAEVISEDALSTTDSEAAATQDQAMDAVLDSEQETSPLAQETTIGVEGSQLVSAAVAEDPEILLYVPTAQDAGVPDITVAAHDDAIAGDDAVQASEDPMAAAEAAAIQSSSPVLGEPVEEMNGVAEVAQLDDVDNQVPEGSFETTEESISAASASLVVEAEVHEAELVGDVQEEADAKGTTEGLSSADASESLSTNEREIERPKSPWTPSYSVTTQGPGIPTAEELKAADLPVLPPPVQISEPGTIEPQPDTALAQSAEPAVTVTSVTDAEAEPAEVPSSSGPTRPWTPSYSVVVQGSPLSAPVGLDSQESAIEAPLETVDVDAPASEDEPNSNVATESSVAMTSLIESRVIVDPATLQDPDIEDDDAPDPGSDAVVAALIESGVLADSITDPVDAPAGALLLVPVAQEGPESALKAETAAEDLESEIMTTSRVPEIETHLSTAQPEPERPKSPWTPSYTVTQQGPVSDGNPEETTAPESETIADTEQEGLLEVMNVSTPAPEAPLDAPRATSPWTPSYSVSVQGSPLPRSTELTESQAQDDAVVDTIDLIHESTATEEVSVDVNTGNVLQEPPVDAVVITEPSAQAESATEPISEVVIDAAVPVPSEQAFDPARTEIGSVIDNAAVEESVASVVIAAKESSEEAVDSTVIEDAEVSAGEDTVAEGITEDQPQLLIPQEQEPERPKSPWTPSYSVVTQGPGIPTTDELEAADLPALPPPAADAALSATEDVTQVTAIAESEPEAVHDQDTSVPISAAPEEALTAEEVSVTGAEDKTLLAEDTAVIPEEHPGVNDSLAPEEQGPERPKSPWTPSYSVTTQGPGIPTTDELEAADLPALPPSVEVMESKADEDDAPATDAVAEDASTLAAVPADVPEVTSVAEEHAATSTEGLKPDELETVEIEPAGEVAEVPVSVEVLDRPEDSPAPVNADSTTATDAESSVVTEEVAPLESTEEPPAPVTDDVPGGADAMSASTSPAVAAPVNVTESEVAREQADDDSISVSVETPADTPVNDSTPLASAISLPEEQQLHPFPVSLEIPFSADDVDEVPPVSPRSRLESTASSLFFPGGWFSKVPVERASLDVAQGEFTSSKPSSPSVPSAPPPTVTEETTEEKKGRWCVVM